MTLKTLRRVSFFLIWTGMLPLLNLTAWVSDNGDGTYTNPPLYADYPDPDIIRVGEDFYFASTTFVNSPGLTILHSKDLVSWEIVSHVVDRLQGKPEFNMQGGTSYRQGIFAPSLRHHDGIFYVVVTPVGLKTRVYSSSTIAGPWVMHELNASAFDPGLFFDDDGSVYIATSGGWDGTVSLLRLNQDLTRVTDTREIFFNKGAEGSKLVKRGEWYYMFHSIPNKLALTVSRAKDLYGKWETKAQIDDTSGGHQGAIVDLPDGSDYGFVMVDAGPIGRITHICPIYWEEGWPVWGTLEAPGQVPTIAVKPVKGFPGKQQNLSDTFESDSLGLQWQWNHNPDDSKWSLLERPGFLRLHATRSDDFWNARNTLTLKSRGPWCRAEVKLELSGMKSGDVCGFGTLGKINGSIAVHAYQQDRRFLSMQVADAEGGASETDHRIRYLPIEGDTLYLRTEMDFVKETALCSYSLDGNNWSELGGDFPLQYDWRTGTFQGAQYALYCYNPEQEAGYVDVDAFTCFDIASTYEQWIHSYFPETTLSTTIGLWADPDHDGLNNATEFLNKQEPNAADLQRGFGKIVPSDPVGSYSIVYPSLQTELDLEQQLSGKLSALNLELREVLGSEKVRIESDMPPLALEGWHYRTLQCSGNIDSVVMLFTSLLDTFTIPVAFDHFEYSGTDLQVSGELSPGTYRNPILTGFYPDPSVCQVGNDFYLINSTFAYYPGLPIFHSKDLVNWKQIGHVIHRPDQLAYDGLGVSRGLFAPAISYHDGLFYVVCTHIDGKGNFVVTANDPAGPWSDPIFTPFEGIDPSLFFDDDGRAWMVNNGAPEQTPLYDGHRAVWLQEFDYHTLQMTGPRKVLVNGGVDISTKPIWIEGPHLFKRDGWYYLSCAEGGTGPGHSQVIFRSKTVDGPYVSWEKNPILTQRSLDPSLPGAVTCTGHADYVIDAKGDWWAVFLGVRPYARDFSPMGRETFLLPVTWTADGWPGILPQDQRVPLVANAPGAALYQPDAQSPMSGNFTWRDDFTGSALSWLWIYLRAPLEQWWSVDETTGTLQLIPRKETLSGKHNPSFLAKRIQHNVFEAELSVAVPETFGVSAGLAVFQNESFHYFAAVKQSSLGPELYLERTYKSSLETIASLPLPATSSQVMVKISSHLGECRFLYSLDGLEWNILAEGLDAKMLTTAVAGGFVGATVGPHARMD